MDYTEQLRVSAAAGTLAQALYYSRAEAWGTAPREWSALDYDEQRVYRDLAVRDLMALRPSRRAA